MCLPLSCIYEDNSLVWHPHLSLTLVSYHLQFLTLQKWREWEWSACGGSAGCHRLINNEHGASKCRDAEVQTLVPGTPSLTEKTFWVQLPITISPVTPSILLTSFSQAVTLARLRRNPRFPNCFCACTEGNLNTGWSDLYRWWRMFHSILCSYGLFNLCVAASLFLRTER